MKQRLIQVLLLVSALLLPARNGPADSFGFTLQSRWSVPGGTTVHRLVFSPDGHWLAAVLGNQARLFEVTEDGPGRDVGSISLSRPEITGIAFSPDGKQIAVVDDGGTLAIFETASRKSLAQVSRAHSGSATSVTFTGDGIYVVTGGHDGKVKAWTPQGQLFADLVGGAKHKGDVLMVAAHGDGRQVLSVGKDRQVILWQIDTQQAIRPMSVEKDVRSAAVGGDGKTLALGLQLLTGNRFRSAPLGSLAQEIHSDDTLRLIDTQSGTQLRDILGEQQDLDTVALSPDGRFVAAGGSGRRASIWDTSTGQRVTSISSDAPLTAITFASDGKRMALGGSDGSLAVFKLSGVGPAVRPKAPSTIIIVILDPSELVGTNRGEIPKIHTSTLRVKGEIKTASPIKSLLVDGQEITSIQKRDSGSYTFNASIPIKEPGQRRFEIVAENMENIVQSQSFIVERTTDAKPESPGVGRRLALIVGISQYSNPKINLRYADRDAQALYQLLINPALGPAAFRPDDVRLLLNEQATAAAINTGLRDFLQKARENDFVLFFFAGHGAPDPNRLLDTYLLAHDTDPDNIAGTGLLMTHVREAIAQIPARDVLILADACHSAGMAAIPGMRDIKENPIHEAFREKLLHASGGLAILAASEAAQGSLENEKWGKHGVFTYFLLQGLQGAADENHDGIVDLSEIMEYVRRQVISATQSNQIPAIGPTSFDRQMPLVIVAPPSKPNSPWR
ncbi:MAG TPA: caspase family protein [Thermoanaerobaculia bacterium]|nr:caspase family protein [Thermoanaerobaculia bacterium]